ncbi:hypothetical protein CDL12_02038 [Handroanthus impetiginosus]|uniref:Uncharacterized protein n=1 Tax=Handroanthus impetiginosus TaxID=429701 RepID=A0A2G9I643_9LAMI|nr:hypothetical protein CDL12_02038 [Handroanthus impetiginosus]
MAGNNEMEAPRRPGTAKQRLEALENENTRLSFVVETLEEKVETMEVEIAELYSELGESRSACQALAEALGESNLADMRREMDTMDAKEVENFIFDMEQYFLATNIVDEARKVSTATMYLTGDAKW